MRKTLVLLAGVLVLGVANYSIYSREKLLTEGTVVYLKTAPIDPRSLMQGDYMALRFEIGNALRAQLAKTTPADGHVVVALDERRVGSFARVDDGALLAANEVRMRYRLRGDQVKFATNAFFFQEGDANLYAKAAYGEFRVDAAGESILTALRDAELVRLGKSAP